jgi:hypothetical protein
MAIVVLVSMVMPEHQMLVHMGMAFSAQGRSMLLRRCVETPHEVAYDWRHQQSCGQRNTVGNAKCSPPLREKLPR